MSSINNFQNTTNALYELDEISNTSFVAFSTSFSVNHDGIWYVAISSISDKNNYMNIYINDIDISKVVSIDDNSCSNNIDIYPNPSNSMIFINNTTDMPLDYVDIIDINGKVLKSFYNFVTSLDISFLSPGTYFVRIYSNNQFIYLKQIIKR